jgi:Zn-dependent protease
MTKAFRIGRIFGIAIEVDYTWFIIFFLLAAALSTDLLANRLPNLSLGVRWLVAGFTAVLFFGSVLVHELSHSLVALRHGLAITGITLFLFGGVSKMAEEPKSPGAEFKIAIAGPLTSIVLAAIFLGAARLLAPAPGGRVFATVFSWLGAVNGVLAVFNMLPGFPLDGGRVLRAGLWKGIANLGEATRIAATFGQALGILMIVGGRCSRFRAR